MPVKYMSLIPTTELNKAIFDIKDGNLTRLSEFKLDDPKLVNQYYKVESGLSNLTSLAFEYIYFYPILVNQKNKTIEGYGFQEWDFFYGTIGPDGLDDFVIVNESEVIKEFVDYVNRSIFGDYSENID